MKNNILLDADQTILDFVRSSKESLAAAMREAGMPYAETDFSVYKRINDAIWREYERGEITKARLSVGRFARFFAEKGIDGDPALLNALYFSKLCRTGYLLDGAAEFLARLKERGRVFLITNGTPAAQYGRLDALGIRSLFDGIFVSDEIGFAKPDPRFFGYVLSAAGAAREDCIVIGDSLTSDIAGANAAGIYSVWYAPQGEPLGAVPDAVARSYAEVLSAVDAAV